MVDGYEGDWDEGGMVVDEVEVVEAAAVQKVRNWGMGEGGQSRRCRKREREVGRRRSGEREGVKVRMKSL